MARRLRPETAVAVAGIRALQVAHMREQLGKLPPSSDLYDHSGQRAYLEARVAELQAGEPVHLQRWELAGELVAVAGLRSRWDRSGPGYFLIDGDQLAPTDPHGNDLTPGSG